MYLYQLAERIKPYGKFFIAAGIAAMLVIPQVAANSAYLVFTLSMICIYTIVNTGLDVLFGYSGQISLGQAGFYAVGAYVSAMLSINTPIPVFFNIFIGAFVAAVLGGIFAYPASKLVHHFLALVTIGFGEIARLVFLNGGKLTGGADGLISIPGLTIGSISFVKKEMFYYFILLLTIVVLFLKRNLIGSRVGRAFISIRENPDASSAFGINVSAYKTLAFMAAAFLAGLGGALYAHLVRFISPETFTNEQSVLFLVMLLLGGKGSLWGSVIGAFLLTFGLEYLQSFGQYRMAIYGAALLLVLFFIPTGITGKLESILEKARAKQKRGEASR